MSRHFHYKAPVGGASGSIERRNHGGHVPEKKVVNKLEEVQMRGQGSRGKVELIVRTREGLEAQYMDALDLDAVRQFGHFYNDLSEDQKKIITDFRLNHY